MDRHLLLVPLFLSCALAAPQFAYTSAFHHPYVPLPFARVPVYDVYNNQLDHSPQEAALEPARLPPSPYHFIPATLPLAIYSEPAHILSGYSYQTLDPAGSKSQVLFVSGPNSQQLFRQNADLLNIVLPSVFNAYGNNFVPSPYPGLEAAPNSEQGENESSPADADAAPAAESDPATNPTSEPADAASSSEPESSSEATSATGASEPKIEDASPKPKSEEDTSLEDVMPTVISPVVGDDTSKEEADKSTEVEGSTSIPAVKDDEVKIDVSTSEASNSVKTVPLEGDSSESASTEIPSTSDKNDASESTGEEVNSGVKSSEDQTTGSVTTIAPAQK